MIDFRVANTIINHYIVKFIAFIFIFSLNFFILPQLINNLERVSWSQMLTKDSQVYCL